MKITYSFFFRYTVGKTDNVEKVIIATVTTAVVTSARKLEPSADVIMSAVKVSNASLVAAEKS